jgi:hypothetical protein
MITTIQRPLNDMKTFSSFARIAGCQSMQTKVFCLALVFGVAMFATGCGKKSAGPAASATPPPPQTNQAAVPPVSPSSTENSQPVPAAQAVNTDTTALTLRDLNRALLKLRMQGHQRPKTFEEFAATTNIQIPPPPAGKKYTLNKKGYIILVDSSTK